VKLIIIPSPLSSFRNRIATFSVRATTIAPMAISAVVSQMATGGLLLAVLLPAVTTWIRSRRLSYLSLTVTAGAVLPFAVLYGRGERRRHFAYACSYLRICYTIGRGVDVTLL